MPRPTYDTKDAIPAGFEDEYEERDGKFVPKAVDDGSVLRETLRKERERADEAEKERKKLERRLTAAESGDEKEKVSKALAKFDTDLAAERQKFEDELAKTRGELRTLKLDDKAKAAFLKAGGRADRVEQAMKLHKDALDLSEDGRIVVKNEAGEVTTTTIDDFWAKQVKATLPDFYTGSKAAGGGASGGAGSNTVKAGAWDFDAILKDPTAALAAAHETGE